MNVIDLLWGWTAISTAIPLRLRFEIFFFFSKNFFVVLLRCSERLGMEMYKYTGMKWRLQREKKEKKNSVSNIFYESVILIPGPAEVL